MTKLPLKHSTVLQGDENEIFVQLIVFVYNKEKQQLKSLRGIPKAKVKCAVNKVNCVLKKTDIRNLIELDNTMCAAAGYASRLVGTNKIPKTQKGALVEEMVRGEVEGT